MTQSVNLSTVTTNVTTQEQKQTKKLNLLENAALGIVFGCLEVAANQPAANFKLETQNASFEKRAPKFSWTPSSMWAGASANVTGIACVTGLQVVFNASLKNHLSNNGQRTLTNQEKFGTAFSAGALGAIFACPSEMVMDKKRQAVNTYLLAPPLYRGPAPTYGQTITEMVKRGGIKTFSKGFFFTAMRDGKFTAGYAFLPDYLSEKFNPYIPSPLAVNILSSCVAGVACATGSHIWDTWKTAKQNDQPYKFWHGSLQKTVEANFAGYRGRTYRVVMAVILFSQINKAKAFWEKYKNETRVT